MFSPTSLLFAMVFFVNSLSPVLARRYPCDNLLVRKEWRNMFPNEKQDYIQAVKCMQTNPAVNPAYPEAKTRFDEFQAHYMKQADNFLNLGQFLPWHRHFIRTYEKALRTECGYKGANPYWDWSQDADSNKSISVSPVFDPLNGFGGNGVAGTYNLPSTKLSDNKILPSTFRGCVRDGPFANYTLNLGPGKLATRHCLTRGIASKGRKYLTSTAVAAISKAATYDAFRAQLEGQAGTSKVKMFEAGQEAVGGEMGNAYSSPGGKYFTNPLFYLHLANIDRVWWNWQQLAPSTRFFDISGPASSRPPVHAVGVDYVLDMGSLGLSVPIRDTLDLWSKPNCYAYL